MVFKVPFISNKGVVASEHYLASKLGVDVLDSGGNAVDAAVATSFVLSTVSPHMGGLGGDFFALYYQKDRDKVYCLNASGFAPKRLTIDSVMAGGYKDGMPSRGPLSITVPGYVYGVFEFHKRFGKEEFSKVISPSIHLCSDGFPVSQRFCLAIDKDYELLNSDEGSRTTFLERKPRSEGSVIKFPNIANALSIIKEHGPSGFYEGEVCKSIVAYVNSKGGVLDEEDMGSYSPEWVTPLCTSYKDYLVYEIPPNSIGITTLLLLNLLNEVDFGKTELRSSSQVKVFAELSSKAYRVKDEYLSDPRFIKIDTKRLLSKDFAQELLKSNEGAPITIGKEGDTTYFAVVDKDGNVVSGIQSLFTSFGSGLTVPEFGITLNCRAKSFKFEGANRLEPRKRPLHTLSATILMGDDEVMALGASGAEYRPQIYAQLITNYVDFKLDLASTIESPRYVCEVERIIAEEGVGGDFLDGYKVHKTSYPGKLGVAQGVLVRNGVKWASCDIRGDGIPIGQAT